MGRKKLTTQVLDNRGSWRASAKQREKSDTPPFQVSDLLPYAQEIVNTRNLSETIKAIPHYDPNTDSEGYHFDPLKAAQALAFFEHYLYHVQGDKAGTLFQLEQWQQAIIANLYGWYDSEGYRRYRECFVFVPRGAGKSAIASGIALYELLSQQHKGAEIYSCAGDREQAKKVHSTAKEMVKESPHLRAMVEGKQVGLFQNSITLNDFDCYKTVSSDAKLREGGNASAVIFDELHVQPNRKLYEVMKKSAAKRRGSLFLSITTAGEDKESICYEVYEYSKKLLSFDVKDPSFLPVIYEASTDDDWKQPATWKKAHPNIGVSIAEQDIAAECKRATVIPQAEFDFKTKFLNMWVGSAARWINMEIYDQCPKTLPSEDQLRAAQCWGGWDMGLTDDLSAFVLYWPVYNCARCWCWIPKDNIEDKELRDKAPYRIWARQGFLKLTEGKTRKDSVIKEDVLQIVSTYQVVKIGADAAYSGELLNELIAARLPIFEWRQGWLTMTAPTKEFERLVIERQFNTGGNPLLRYCVEGAGIEQQKDAVTDACRPVKTHRNRKIDVLLALIDALGISMREKKQVSSYANRTATTIIRPTSSYAMR